MEYFLILQETVHNFQGFQNFHGWLSFQLFVVEINSKSSKFEDQGVLRWECEWWMGMQMGIIGKSVGLGKDLRWNGRVWNYMINHNHSILSYIWAKYAQPVNSMNPFPLCSENSQLPFLIFPFLESTRNQSTTILAVFQSTASSMGLVFSIFPMFWREDQNRHWW